MTSSATVELLDASQATGMVRDQQTRAGCIDMSQAESLDEVWSLRPPCMLSPAQLAMALGLAGGVSVLISLGFWVAGATWVLPFACVETICLSLAFVLYALRTQELEEVALRGQTLILRQGWGAKARVEMWPLAQASISCGPNTGYLIEIRSGVRSVQMGSGLGWGQRMGAVRTIGRALRQANEVSN